MISWAIFPQDESGTKEAMKVGEPWFITANPLDGPKMWNIKYHKQLKA
tara:strand:- start:827 stop:970 length:144 start_codon:yes stop_codon:yes gene_type:complete